MANREAEGYVQQTPEIVQFSLKKGILQSCHALAILFLPPPKRRSRDKNDLRSFSQTYEEGLLYKSVSSLKQSKHIRFEYFYSKKKILPVFVLVPDGEELLQGDEQIVRRLKNNCKVF